IPWPHSRIFVTRPLWPSFFSVSTYDLSQPNMRGGQSAMYGGESPYAEPALQFEKQSAPLLQRKQGNDLPLDAPGDIAIGPSGGALGFKDGGLPLTPGADDGFIVGNHSEQIDGQ